MTLNKKLSLTATLAVIFSGCAPFPPEDNTVPKQAQADPVPVLKEKKPSESEVQRQKEASRKRLEREKREAARLKKQEAKEKEATQKTETTTNPSPVTPPVKPTSKYPTALAIPGRPGEVFNPYTNAPVDVSGVPSGRLVTDPNDSQGRKFRVP